MTAAAIPLESIPAELRTLPQWVCWKSEVRDGKPTKVPYAARNGHQAASTRAEDWADIETARTNAQARSYDGIGFVFTDATGMVGIDLDHCLLPNGQPKPWAEKIVAAFAAKTYVEVSPSGAGVKIWAKGMAPWGAEKTGRRQGYEDGAVEMYVRGRFFTVTGRRIPSAQPTVGECQKLIDALYAKVFAREQAEPTLKPVPVDGPPTLEDNAIIEKLLTEKGHKAARLWSGNQTDYTSPSEADMALLCKLVFYVGDDADRIDRLFRQSLLCREKWTNRPDYRAESIAKAVATVRGRYKPGSKPAEAPIKTPGSSAGLLKLIEETIAGKRKNIRFGTWDVLTGAAHALTPGSSTVICGGSGSTKSMFISEASLAWLDADVPFAVFHLEDDREKHLNRALAQLENNGQMTLLPWQAANADAMRDGYERHMGTLDALSASMWDAPDGDVAVSDLVDWVRDRATEGRRIIVVDPVTAADSGKEPWAEDRKYVLHTKRIIRQAGASLVTVTHPRDGNVKGGGTHLDNMAGGKSFNRHTSNVLWLEALDEGEMLDVTTPGGTLALEVNRILKLLKVRDGPARGMHVGFFFEPRCLRFFELGAIRKRKP